MNINPDGFSPANRLLGFDGRRSLAATSQLLTAPRNKEYSEHFLLRQDVRVPLSVDTSIWPELESARVPGWNQHSYHQGIWSNLEVLQQRIKSSAEVHEVVIAITLEDSSFQDRDVKQYSTDHPPQVQHYLHEIFPDSPLEPEALDPAWEFLGFDICDSFLLSALMNCGYNPEQKDVDELRKEWTPKINRYHLLETLESAIQFAALSNLRVPEHAPFYVVGLWCVTGIEQLAE